MEPSVVGGFGMGFSLRTRLPRVDSILRSRISDLVRGAERLLRCLSWLGLFDSERALLVEFERTATVGSSMPSVAGDADEPFAISEP